MLSTLTQLGLEGESSGCHTHASSYVLQWRGLPYGEATFETKEDIEKAGGAEDIAELHVRPYPCSQGLGLRL